MKVKHKIYDLQIAAFHLVGQELVAKSLGLEGTGEIWKVANPGPDDRTWRASFQYYSPLLTAHDHRLICLAGWLAETLFRDAVSRTQINQWLADPSDLAENLASALDWNEFSASETEGLQGWTWEDLVEVLQIQKKYWTVLEAEAKEWITWALAEPVTA